MDHLSEGERIRLTAVDHRDHEALVAFNRAGELVEVARYFRLEDRPAAAEVALTVADRWQQRAIGTALLERLMAKAQAAGSRRASSP